MDEKNNIGKNEFYDESDVDDMLEKLSEIGEANYNSSNKIMRRFSEKEVDEISVVELQSPYPLGNVTNDEGSFYSLMNQMVDIINQLSKENKYQSQKINKIHHDLSRINNDLINIDNTLQITNLIKLFENEIIDDKVLIQELRKVSNLFDSR